MGKFLSISQNTFVQTIRQPIFGILILVTFAILALELCQAGWTMTSDYVLANQTLLHRVPDDRPPPRAFHGRFAHRLAGHRPGPWGPGAVGPDRAGRKLPVRL